MQYVSTNWLAPEIGDKLLPETHAYVLKPSQGGMAHGEAEGLTANVGMSLRTTERAAQNIDPSSSMSLRATGVTKDNVDPSSSMSLRATGVTEKNTDPNSSMPLRATGVEPDNTDINSSISLQAAGPAAVSSSSMSLRTAGLTTEGPALDPTQASFVQHMSSWMNAYKSEAASFKANLPMSQDPEDRENLTEPVLLLGTAGTGKTTTLQAANRLLETHGLAGRIVRCAYTGVAASNMGMGGRTLVSLFRLSRRGFGGGLEALSPEDVLSMDQELKGMCLLEIDEVSMLEKLVLAHVHARLQQWRLALYHEKHCRSKTACRCGARLPFGGVKVVFAGELGNYLLSQLHLSARY